MRKAEGAAVSSLTVRLLERGENTLSRVMIRVARAALAAADAAVAATATLALTLA